MTPRPAPSSSCGAIRTRSGAERVALAVRSDLSLADQVKAEGATWLDRRLVERTETPLAHAGFGQEVREALSARIDHLAARRPRAAGKAQRVTFARDLLATLRRRELDADRRKARQRDGTALPTQEPRAPMSPEPTANDCHSPPAVSP